MGGAFLSATHVREAKDMRENRCGATTRLLGGVCSRPHGQLLN